MQEKINKNKITAEMTAGTLLSGINFVLLEAEKGIN